jgi:hypothetical protein
MFEEGMNKNLYTNDKGMRVHANNSTPMTAEETSSSTRGSFGGTYAQSKVPNPQNSDYTTKAISAKGEYNKRMKSAEALDKLRG